MALPGPHRPVPRRLVVLRRTLGIEVDGGQHAEAQVQDEARTRFIEREGYRLIRFWNNDVMENLEGIIATIGEALQTTPLPSGEGGTRAAKRRGRVRVTK